MDQRDPESLFSAWAEEAERLGSDAAPDFDALLAAHPDHADVLRRMHADWLHFAPLLARVVPGLMASHMGLGEASLPSGADDAAQPVTPELLDRLGIQVPDSGRYRFRGVLGQGGGGVVLRVWDQKLQRSLAMKVVLGASELRAGQPRAGQDTPPVDAAVLTRFVDEARIASQLDHPSIVPVHELGTDATGRAYFTMRLVRGQDLHRILEARRNGDPEWSETRLLGLLAKACEAVGYAHERGVVHRDLKPSNIMVGRHGEVHVMDWGLARVLVRDAAARAASAAATPRPREPQRSEVRSIRRAEREATPGSPLLTGVGAALGTPAYMAPEQARGEHDRVDARADVYALGAILYELLGGTPPFVPAGANVDAGLIYLRLLDGPPRPIRDLAPRAPEQLIAITERAMARDASERYPDVRALETDLRAFLERRVVRAYRTGALAETGQWVRRNPLLAASLGALLSVVLGSALVLAERERELRRRSEEIVAAREQEKRANEELISETYSTAIFRSGVALERGELRSAREWLAAAPQTSRGWEWGYLDKVLNGESLTIEEPQTALHHAVYGPDGSLIAALGGDGIVRVYDSSQGRCVMQSRVITENGGEAFSLTFSPDGERLVVGDRGQHWPWTEHWVLNSATGSLVASLRRADVVSSHTAATPNPHFAHDGRDPYILYDRESDSFLRYRFGPELALEVLDGRGIQVARLPLPSLTARPYYVSISPQRHYVAIHDGRHFTVWDLRSFACVARTEFYADTAFGTDLISFSPDERFVVVFDSGNSRLMAFDLGASARDTVLAWNHEFWSPGDLSFTSDGLSVVAIGFYVDSLTGKYKYGVAGWNLIAPMPAPIIDIEARMDGYAFAYTRFLHSKTASCVLLSTGLSLLSLDSSANFAPSVLVESFQLQNRADAVGVESIDTSESFALDDDSQVWTLRGQPAVFPLGGPHPHDNGYESRMHSSTQQVCATSNDGTLRVWNLTELITPLRHALSNVSGVDDVCYAGAAGATIAVVLEAGSDSAWIGIYDGHTGKLLRRLESAGTECIYSSPDAKRMLTVGSNIRLWDTASWDSLATILSGVVRSNLIGRHYFVIDRDGTFAVYRLSDGSLVHESITAFDSSGRGQEFDKVLAVLHGDIAITNCVSGTPHLLDLSSLAPVNLERSCTLLDGIDWYSPVCLNNDGTRVLGVREPTRKSGIILMDLHKSAPVATYTGATSYVDALTLHPNESRVVAVTGDGMLHIWDARSTRQLLRLRVSEEVYRGALARFSPDGRTLLLTGINAAPQLLVSSIGTSLDLQSGSR